MEIPIKYTYLNISASFVKWKERHQSRVAGFFWFINNQIEWKLKHRNGFVFHKEQIAVDDLQKRGGRNAVFVFLLRTTIMCFQYDASWRSNYGGLWGSSKFNNAPRTGNLKPTHCYDTPLMKNVINKWADEFGSDKWGTWRTLCIFDSDLIHLAGVDVD